MSQQFIHIPALLKPEEIAEIENLSTKADFVDGKLTASLAAKAVKNNLQLDLTNQEIAGQIQGIIRKALSDSPIFQAAALPQTIYPAIISKYSQKKYYGWHVDSPIMGNPPIRTDLAITIFLSDPASYEGGELMLQTNSGMVNFKPPKGDAIVYPCQFLHCVNEVKSGERMAAVTWVQSQVKSPEQREILFSLNQIHAVLYQRDPHAPETNLLLQSYSNLVRMWSEL